MTMSERAWRAGISIGTAHTVAMLRAPGMRPRPILTGGSPLTPSSADPIYPGRRDPLWAGSLLPQHLARIAVEVRRAAGSAAVETTVGCPPEWESSRRAALADVVTRAGLGGVEVVSETVAAAASLGDDLPVGGSLLVVDAGASSCDVGVVRRTAGGYEQPAFESVEDTGGIRLDTALVTLVGARIAEHDRTVWHRLEDPITAVDRAARLLLWEEVRALKERLSFEETTTLTVPLADTALTVTRTEFEALAQPVLTRVVRAVREIGPAAWLLIIGGGSRIPLLRSLVEAATGLDPITVKEPELAVAEGCALLERRDAPLLDEDVQFTVYRPERLPPQRWESLVVYAHKSDPVVDPVTGPYDPVASVRQRATRFFAGEPGPSRTVDARQPLARGTRIRVVPELPGVECNPPEAVLDWQEPVHELAFRVRATATAPEVVRGFVRVWCGPLVIAEVSLALPVAPGDVTVERRSEPITRYRKIFPSYSSRDRAIVDEFATVARALGDQYLQDVVTLRSGERWSSRLLELIAEADVFQLFWSSNSMVSEHCRAEWECALALGRPSFVRPLYWEEPLPEARHLGLPPESLRRLHFARVAVGPSPGAAGPPGPAQSGAFPPVAAPSAPAPFSPGPSYPAPPNSGPPHPAPPYSAPPNSGPPSPGPPHSAPPVSESPYAAPRVSAPQAWPPPRSAPPPSFPRSPAPQPTPAPTARLLFTGTDGGSTSFALPEQRTVMIGTAPNADLRLADSYASRRHAEISPAGGRFWVGDLGSTNGTTLNGRRLHDREPLHPGDVIGVGRTRLEFAQAGDVAWGYGQPPPAAREASGGGGGLIAAGAGIAVAGIGWWFLSAYAAMVVGLGALLTGLVLVAVGVIRAARR